MTILEHNVPAGEVIPRPPPTSDSCRVDGVCLVVCVCNVIERLQTVYGEAVGSDKFMSAGVIK